MFAAGFTARLHAPLAALVAVPICVEVAAPQAWAITVTVSPAWPFETTPETLVDVPNRMTVAPGVSVTPWRTMIRPRSFCAKPSRYENDPDLRNRYEYV